MISLQASEDRRARGSALVDAGDCKDGSRRRRYGIGVGREGFTWSGIERVSRLAEWPDWNPPRGTRVAAASRLSKKAIVFGAAWALATDCTTLNW